MIRRSSYLQRLLELKDQNLIKVVTGVRRSGKSTIMEAFKNELIESGVAKQNITFLKVEDYNNEALSYSLLDEQGKLVMNEQITNQETQVAMSTLARGAYFINVLQANKKIQTFKIIKN